jgi:hypothetical protein
MPAADDHGMYQPAFRSLPEFEHDSCPKLDNLVATLIYSKKKSIHDLTPCV